MADAPQNRPTRQFDLFGTGSRTAPEAAAPARPAALPGATVAPSPFSREPAPPGPAARAQPVQPPPPAVTLERANPSAGRVLSVSELTRDLKGAIEGRFARVAVRGEISNYRPAGSGHVYFTLKDDGACIAAVLFRGDASRLKFALRDGLLVVARGRLSLYEARGQYQIVVEALEPEGAGALALAFEQLKAKLSKEGLFDPARKRKIPFLPRRIGLVTSPTGAAIRDFLRVLQDRFPIPVLLCAARVQGEGAAEEIARAVKRLAASGLVDVIVVTRGGGSIEDLWAFNEEVVARAIAASPVPVVSAVGHEVDFTISDFVADRRCATPTDAAKTLAPPREDLARALDQHRRHLQQIMLRQVGLRRERMQLRRARLGDPRRLIGDQRLALDHRADGLREALVRANAERRVMLSALGQRLAREHPQSRLVRLHRLLASLQGSLGGGTRTRLGRERGQLAGLAERLRVASPVPTVGRAHRTLSALRERLQAAGNRQFTLERVRLSKAAARLDSLSPLAVLGRGYAIAFREGGQVLRSADEAPAGTPLTLLLPDQSALVARSEGKKGDAGETP